MKSAVVTLLGEEKQITWWIGVATKCGDCDMKRTTSYERVPMQYSSA